MAAEEHPLAPHFRDGARIVFGNKPEQFRTAQKFGVCDNVIITSHYSALNFVPLFLFEQFRRFANAYFLLVCILQTIDAVSITDGIPTSAVPLASVLLFDGFVTAVEDYRRHQDDHTNNSKPVMVCRDGRFVQMSWRDVHPGDIIKVEGNKVVPADCLFLRSFPREGADGGTPSICYVQTAQLDGETNLKLRQMKQSVVDLFSSDAACGAFDGCVKAAKPSQKFSDLNAKLQFRGRDWLPNAGSEEQVSLKEKDQLLLRGVVLKNVGYVYALVLYTGEQTKVRVAQGVNNMKVASVEAVINRNILYLVGVLVALCIIGAVGYTVETNELREGHHWYLQLDDPTFWDVLAKVGTFFLLNSAMVPISLYVTMKMARTGQKWFMEHDADMYYEDVDQLELTGGAEGTFPMRVRTMDLNDELGQVSHIFSDKTGTFTLNYMELRKISVGSYSFGLGTTQIGLAGLRRKGAPADVIARRERENAIADKQDKPVPHVNFLDGSDTHPILKLSDFLNDADFPSSRPAKELHHFLLHLVLNHTVVPEERKDAAGNTRKTLSASSPDEEAFVYTGQFFGYEFIGDKDGRRTIRITKKGVPGHTDVVFRMLEILSYDNARKCMSVIVQHPDGRIYLYLKGADSAVFKRLKDFDNSHDGQRARVRHSTANLILNDWGSAGLRTMCFAWKEIDPVVFYHWHHFYRAADRDMDEIAKRKQKQPNQITMLANLMEDDVHYQGSTANEDKLQPGVPATIETLAHGGIKIWMLTGDKEETAKNIGYATRMLNADQKPLEYSSASLPKAADLRSAVAREANEIRQAGMRPRTIKRAMVIDDKSLDILIPPGAVDEMSADAQAQAITDRKNLYTVANECAAVICCRARPSQKAALVQLIRDGSPSVRTLAIGDGANDVDMIQTAHVGVGIAGAEGVQAANASDFSIGRFRFLQRLLLVHGRWNYRRMSKLVCYMFYKNIAFVLAQFWYTMLTGWSGQKFYVELASQSFNIIYTGAPIVLLGLMDQDVTAEEAQEFPLLYKDGPDGKRFNIAIFWGWVLQAVFESVVCVVVCAVTMETMEWDGASASVFELGTWVFSAIVIVTSLRVAMEMHAHSRLFQVVLFLSVVSWLPFMYIFDALDANGIQGGTSRMFGSWMFWLDMLLISAVCMLRPFAWSMAVRWWYSEYRHVVQYAALVTHDYDSLRPNSGKPTEEIKSPGQQEYDDSLMSPAERERAQSEQAGFSSTLKPHQVKLQRAYRKLRNMFQSQRHERAALAANNRVTGSAYCAADASGAAVAAAGMVGASEVPAGVKLPAIDVGHYADAYARWLSEYTQTAAQGDAAASDFAAPTIINDEPRDTSGTTFQQGVAAAGAGAGAGAGAV